MARKPAHLSQVGGRSNRQRVWEALRVHRTNVTLYALARAAMVDDDTVLSYLRCLIAGEYVAKTGPTYDTATYSLLRDVGCEAPRLNRDGTPNSQGQGTEAMWRALRILQETSAEELARYASAATPTAVNTAKAYLAWLAKAGYVQTLRQRGRATRYRLLLSRYSGPRPPMIQRTRQVYDPNLGKVVWAEAPEEQL